MSTQSSSVVDIVGDVCKQVQTHFRLLDVENVNSGEIQNRNKEMFNMLAAMQRAKTKKKYANKKNLGNKLGGLIVTGMGMDGVVDMGDVADRR